MFPSLGVLVVKPVRAVRCSLHPAFPLHLISAGQVSGFEFVRFVSKPLHLRFICVHLRLKIPRGSRLELFPLTVPPLVIQYRRGLERRALLGVEMFNQIEPGNARRSVSAANYSTALASI
jgi:hypothetical protein